MGIQVNSSNNGSDVTIVVSGRFDFSVHRAFRDAYTAHAPGAAYRVDLSGAEYMDSSALGMLLLLREHAGGECSRVLLDRPVPMVRKILEIANFDKLFQLG